MSRLTGYSVEEFLESRTVTWGKDIIYLPEQDRVWHEVQTALKSKKSFELEYRIKTKTGEIRWVWERGQGVYSPEWVLLFLEGFIADITERVRSEAKTRKLLDRVEENRKTLRFLCERLVTIQEAERKRIALELHDEIGQILTGVKYNIESCESLSGTDLKNCLRGIKENIGELMKKVRELSLELCPSMLDDAGLIPTLLWYLDRYSSNTGIHVDLQSNIKERLTHSLEITLYRVIQEALTNAARHSGADVVYVCLERQDNSLVLRIRDEGKGFVPEEIFSSTSLSVGLRGIKERVSWVDGTLNINSAPGKGTELCISIPLDGSRND